MSPICLTLVLFPKWFRTWKRKSGVITKTLQTLQFKSLVNVCDDDKPSDVTGRAGKGRM